MRERGNIDEEIERKKERIMKLQMNRRNSPATSAVEKIVRSSLEDNALRNGWSPRAKRALEFSTTNEIQITSIRNSVIDNRNEMHMKGQLWGQAEYEGRSKDDSFGVDLSRIEDDCSDSTNIDAHDGRGGTDCSSELLSCEEKINMPSRNAPRRTPLRDFIGHVSDALSYDHHAAESSNDYQQRQDLSLRELKDQHSIIDRLEKEIKGLRQLAVDMEAERTKKQHALETEIENIKKEKRLIDQQIDSQGALITKLQAKLDGVSAFVMSLDQPSAASLHSMITATDRNKVWENGLWWILVLVLPIVSILVTGYSSACHECQAKIFPVIS